MGMDGSDRIAEIFAQNAQTGKVACNFAKYEAKIR
jgi:hypothetical protein